MSEAYLYTFQGKVYPERSNVCMSKRYMKLDIEHLNISGTAYVEILYSHITVEFKANNIVTDLLTLKYSIENIVRQFVDATGFLQGWVADIEIDGMMDYTTYKPYHFPTIFKPVYEKKTLREKQIDVLLELYDNSTSANLLFLCISDLREAYKKPKDTPFFCYRAIESVCQYFVDLLEKQNTDNESWMLMKSELSLDKNFADDIKEKAIQIRHGKLLGSSDEDRIKMLSQTWLVIDRFVSYLYKKKTGKEIILP